MEVSWSPYGLICGTETLIREQFCSTAEYKYALKKKLPPSEVIYVQPQHFDKVQQHLANFYIVRDVRMSAPTPVPLVAAVTPIITGAGSNNIELGTTQVKIERFSYFALKNWLYFNCRDLTNDKPFVYYLNLNNMKRYWKENCEPESSVHMEDLSNLELTYFGYTSTEEIKKRFCKAS